MIVVAILAVLSFWTMNTVDRPLAIWMRGFPEDLSTLAHTITRFGEGVEVLLVSGLILISLALVPVTRWRRRRMVGANAFAAGAAFIFLSVAGGGLLALISKYIIGRSRPDVTAGENPLYMQPFVFHSDYAAFPSGHAATAGAMAMALALVFPYLRSVLIPLGVLIALSRQMVGVHWPSDTLMGWAVGVGFTLWLAHIFARRRLLFAYASDGTLARRRGVLPLVSLFRRA